MKNYNCNNNNTYDDKDNEDNHNNNNNVCTTKLNFSQSIWLSDPPNPCSSPPLPPK